MPFPGEGVLLGGGTVGTWIAGTKTMGDLARAYAHLLTGTDGASPHLPADLLAALRKGGHDAALGRVSLHPMRIDLAVDGAPVHVRQDEHGDDGERWFCVKRGTNKVVRVNAGRTAAVPVGEMPDATPFDPYAHLARDWMALWPRPGDAREDPHEAMAAYARRVTGEDVRVVRQDAVGYVSEAALAAAVELLLNAE